MLNALLASIGKAWKLSGVTRYEQAIQELDRALEIAARVEEHGLTWIGYIKGYQAQCAHDQGDYERAFDLAYESMCIHHCYKPGSGFPMALFSETTHEWCLAFVLMNIENVFDGVEALQNYVLVARGYGSLGRDSLEAHVYRSAGEYCKNNFGTHEYEAWLLDAYGYDLYCRGNAKEALEKYQLQLELLLAFGSEDTSEAQAQVGEIVRIIREEVKMPSDQGGIGSSVNLKTMYTAFGRLFMNPLCVDPLVEVKHVSING